MTYWPTWQVYWTRMTGKLIHLTGALTLLTCREKHLSHILAHCDTLIHLSHSCAHLSDTHRQTCHARTLTPLSHRHTDTSATHNDTLFWQTHMSICYSLRHSDSIFDSCTVETIYHLSCCISVKTRVERNTRSHHLFRVCDLLTFLFQIFLTLFIGSNLWRVLYSVHGYWKWEQIVVFYCSVTVIEINVM